MKREYHHPQLLHSDSNSLDPSMAAGSSSAGDSARYSVVAPTENFSEKSKLWESAEAHQDAGRDELLAMLGYEVKSSDMPHVALRLQQLEEALFHVQDGISHLASETVHYNPSDLPNWIEAMLSELNPPPTLVAPAESSTITSLSFSDKNNNLVRNAQQESLLFEDSSSSDYDLKAIPGKALYTQNYEAESSSSRNSKRLKSSSGSNPELFSSSSSSSMRGFSNVPAESTRSVVLVDLQENGVRLVHTLMACAESVQRNNLNAAQALLKQIKFLAASQSGAMRKVASYFAEALACRIYGVCPENPVHHSPSNTLQLHFYETYPFLKFAHFTANQTIFEAFEGKKRVHVIDFSINQGMQWPVLLQALARRPEGPPSFRLTGIGDNSDHLQEVGWKLAQFAEAIHVPFEYRGLVLKSLSDLDSSMLELRPSEIESSAVNSVFELHKLLAKPGALEKVLSIVKQIKPEVMIVAEPEAKHNGPVFLDRFTESLHYYSTLFDSLEGTTVNSQDKAVTEVYLGKQICNVVACEDLDRIERHETLVQWRIRLTSSGFEPVHIGSNAFKQASMWLAWSTDGDGYRVEENNGCLMLGWHTRPLIATSAWKLGRD